MNDFVSDPATGDGRPSGISDTDTYLTRVFAAPRELVFRFFTEPALLAQWFGPVGYSAPAERMSLGRTVGERFDFEMVEDASGLAARIDCEILEFDEPEFLALRMLVSTPSAPEPFLAELRVQFHDHGNRTRITLHQGPFAFTEMRRGNDAGWRESFGKLDSALAAATR